MNGSNGPRYKHTSTEGFSNPDIAGRSKVLQTTKTMSLDEIKNRALPFSFKLNNKTNAYPNYAANCKAFQVEDNLEAEMSYQTDSIPATQELKNVDHHAINVKEICGTDSSCETTETAFETKQDESNFSYLEDSREVKDLGIIIREISSRDHRSVPERLCSRQSSIVNLKEHKSRLLHENFEYVVGVKESIEIKRDLTDPPDKERLKHSNAQIDEEFTKQQLQHEERKFGEQPHSLIEDEFVNLAISQTKADFIRQETIHLHEHQARYEGDFVSLRSSKIKGPRKVKEIGRGAFGKCFQVEYASNSGRTIHIAVKEIENRKDITEDKRRKEYLILRKLIHPNIVRCYWEEMDPMTKQYSIAMEYLSCGSVSDLLQLQKGGFGEELIKHYTVQLLQGLAYLHSMNILHRDIKGENLLLCEDFNDLKICDFGCATFVDCIDNGYTDTQLVGTVPFMAPEIVVNNAYSAASDVWSVGCCIIQMATGQLPWNANRNEQMTVLFKIGTTTDPPPIPECLSNALQNLTRQCLFIDKKNRLSAEELQYRLQKAILPEI